MNNKTIAFERWLINNYPKREDNPDYECNECDGDGIFDSDEYEFYPEWSQHVRKCILCGGTGSSMYDEYEKQCEIDQERLRKFSGGNKPK